MKIKYRKKTIIPIIIFASLLLSEYLSQIIAVFSYADEIVMTIFSIVFLSKFLSGDRLEKVTYRALFIIFIITVPAILANAINGIQKNHIAVVLDIVSKFKIFICFYGIYETVKTNYDAHYILCFFSQIAKAFLIIGTICGITSLFVDIGMRGQERFGIYAFNFIYGHAHIYSMSILIAIMIVVHCDRRNSTRYIFMSIIQMLLTTKGPSIMWAAGILVLMYYMRDHKKIGGSVIAGVGVLGLTLGSFQVQNYLLNENAPRFLFYKYGLITALRYFPLGAGFATFGSDMAAKYYSPLYVEYGISNIRGMSADDTSFLRDNYWPMILGQFDFIGLFLFIVLFYMIFKMLQKITLESKDKAMILSAFIYMIVHSIGSSTPTTSAAVTMMMFIALILRTGCEEKRVNGKIRN